MLFDMKEGVSQVVKVKVESPVENQEVVKDPYATWTDDRRIEEYAQTGDVKYITPDLAMRMGLDVSQMREVPGVTEDAIAFALRSKESFKKEEIEHEDSLLGAYGADAESLKLLPFPEQIKTLLILASMRQSSADDFDPEFVRFAAQEKLRNFLLEHEGAVYILFDSLRYSDPKGLRDMKVVEDMYKMIHQEFVLLSHTPGEEITEEEKERGYQAAQVLNEFANTTPSFVQGEFDTEATYLFAERARAFAYETLELSEQNDFDIHKPFEISKGMYAVFTADKDRVYVADVEQSTEIKRRLEHAPPIQKEETGQYFARFTRIRAPEEYYEAVDEIIDAGTSLDDIFQGFAIQDKDLLQDYITMLQSPSRLVIEDDFGVQLKDLTIREQFYFLNYLKQTNVEKVAEVGEFVSAYGIDGLRTFLVTESDPALRQEVFSFAQESSYDEGKAVFEAYGKLVESIDTVGEYLHESFDSKERGATGEVVERLLTRARTLLHSAHEYKEEPEKLVSLVEGIKADVHLFTDACRVLKTRGELNLETIKDGSLEKTIGRDLAPADTKVMRQIWDQRYAGKYPSELEAKLRESFEGALQDDNAFFYIYRHDGKVVSFFRIDSKGADVHGLEHKHLASLMTDENISGGKLGEALFESALDREQENSVLVGECDPGIGITEKYLELGFVATRYYLDQGEPTFAIERKGDKTRSHGLSRNEIKIQALVQTPNFFVGDQSPDFASEITDSRVLTRYFKEKDIDSEKVRYYACFEDRER